MGHTFLFILQGLHFSLSQPSINYRAVLQRLYSYLPPYLLSFTHPFPVVLNTLYFSLLSQTTLSILNTHYLFYFYSSFLHTTNVCNHQLPHYFNYSPSYIPFNHHDTDVFSIPIISFLTYFASAFLPTQLIFQTRTSMLTKLHLSISLLYSHHHYFYL